MSKQRGLTLVELAVVLALVGILGALAAPAMGRMMGNAQVRGLSDALQNGLRLAQAEAQRRNRVTVFYRSDDASCSSASTPSATGRFWVIRVLPMRVGEAAEVVQCGSVGDLTAGSTVTGPTALCFSAEGRLAARDAATLGLGSSVTCAVGTGAQAYDLSSTRSDRPLRVRVTSAGSVRLCDPARVFSTSTPDGCPA